MSQPLQYFYKELKRKFGNDLKSAYEVNGVERRFIGFELETNSLLVDVEIECLKLILGEGNYKITFQPNSNKIYIQ